MIANMLKVINKSRKTLLYGMVISAIIDLVGINTRCDPPKQHAMHTTINEHAINKLGLLFVNKTWAQKETMVKLEIVRDEESDDSRPELNANPSVDPSANPSYQPMSTAFEFEQAFTRFLSYMESIDARIVGRLITLEAQTP
ncbi:Uncharacterized protein TCM_009689 [Theobroma cacao]|uniref:Uncharacterized protein n=1 Tax=Theobroma cacao TaxID=3641 RepID=A0A061E694_THECC|nr:Uncharacterized protein TCM_009689 [Theobroma cacao]